MSADDPSQRSGQRSQGMTSSNAGPLDALADLDPAYFGFVMSTGIVSIAFRELAVDAVAWPLAVFNVGCFALLSILFGVRAALFPGRMAEDLRDRKRHWGSLTFVVATNTVGAQVLIFFDDVAIATTLWITAVVATPLLLYYLFAIEIIGERKAAVTERIDGAFLLVVVCVQSVAVLGGLLSETATPYARGIALLSLGSFGSGYVLYFVVVTVVTYRLLDGRVRQSDWTGPYWITMGAAAITTLAGTTLAPRLGLVPAWEAYAPVIVGVTFLAWAIATWWIPLLLVLDVWKFLTDGIEGRPPVWTLLVPWSRLGFGRRLHTYAPTAWGRVFPMGMYTACTVNLAGVSGFAPLEILPTYWGWFALLVWSMTLLGTVRALGRVVTRTSRT